MNDYCSGGKKGVFEIKDDNGEKRTLELKKSIIDPLPKVHFEGKEYLLDRKLPWYELVWAGSPFLLVFSGGGLGALIGMTATYIGIQIFRSERSTWVKYLTVALSSIGAFILFFVSVIVLQIIIQPQQ